MDYCIVQNISKFLKLPEMVTVVRKCINVEFDKKQENEVKADILVRKKEEKLKNKAMLKIFCKTNKDLNEFGRIQEKCYSCKKKIVKFKDLYLMLGDENYIDFVCSETCSYCEKCFKFGLFNFIKTQKCYPYMRKHKELQDYQKDLNQEEKEMLKKVSFPKIYEVGFENDIFDCIGVMAE